MIKSIDIKNFQSHMMTSLEFSKGVNGIIGLSQSGKTAILRAFNLLATNRPQGAKYFRKKTSTKELCAIQVILFTGEHINVFKEFTKKRDGTISLKDTYYELDGKVWKGSKEVPDEVKRLLNLGELNIQNQLDPPFLVTSSSGEIAKTINRVTHLEKVDEFVGELNKKIKTLNTQKSFREDELEKVDAVLDQLPNTDKADRLLKRLQTLYNKKQKLNEEMSLVLFHFDEIINCRKRLTEAQQKMDVIADIEKKLADFETLKEDREVLEEDKELLEEYLDVVDSNFNNLERLKTLKQDLEALLSEQEVCPTCDQPINVKQMIKDSFQ